MSMSRNIKVYVGLPTEPRRLVGEIMPFSIQPSGKQQGDLGGVSARFEWIYEQVSSVIVATQAEADVLQAALSPK